MAKQGNIPLKSFRPLLELLQPLDEKEAIGLRDYMATLMPDQHATDMPYQRFCAFASALESMAYRRSWQTGDESRRIIFKILSEHGGNDGLQGSPVPAGKGPKDGPSTAEIELELEEKET